MKEKIANAQKKVNKAADSRYPRHLIQYGYIVRGVIYILIGYYGIQSAFGVNGQIKNPTDILQSLPSIFLGNFILIAILIGLASYGIWGLLRAFVNPLNEEQDAWSVFLKLGYITSGLYYLFLSFLALQIVRHVHLNPSFQNTSKLIEIIPFGHYAISILGGLIILTSTEQIIYGLRKKFKKTFTAPATRKGKRIIKYAGQVGIVTRGLIFLLIGILLFKAGLHKSLPDVKNLSDALNWIDQKIKIPLLLAVVSSGILTFGVYSVLISRLIIINKDENNKA